MANFYVTHHLFPSNPQLFTIAIHKVAGFQPEQNPNFKPTYAVAERFWKIFVHTSGLDSLGESVGPVVADVVGSSTTIKEFVDATVANLCGQIDWSQQGQFSVQIDSQAPIIIEQFPRPSQTNVPISSPVVLRVQDPLPGDGIDVSTVTLKIDGLSVVPVAVGNKFDTTFSFSPIPLFND